MSSQINTFGNIVDLEGVKKCLYVGGLTSGSPSLSSGSNNGAKKGDSQDVWGWSVDDGEKPRTHPNWLEECGLSLSPTGELMALTHQQNLVILTSKWDSSEESSSKNKYYMTWHGDPCQEHNETITSVCVLAMAAPQTQKSSHFGPDWTCISLGFSSGALRFFTEKGDLLLSEVLGEGPVVSIKCQTATSSRHQGQPELTDELHVSYRNTVCAIYGFVLSNTLRACRNQLARVQANCSEGIVAPPLSLHRWGLPDQDNMADCAVGLPQCPSAFSHLHLASVCGGFSTRYRPSPPQSFLVVTAGNKPFVGFHYIVEGSSAPVLTDVVRAVGTKLKSALNQAVPSWFLKGRKPNPPPEKDKVVIEPAEPMSCRFGLCDLWRQGTSVVMSPRRNLCAVPDSLGRIMLIDNTSGLSLRMWKGYRDAQCGWLTAEEEQAPRGQRRSALFLVIYAPKKAMVEVWAMQQGPKIASFSVSKNGRLFYMSQGLLGTSSLSSKTPNRSSTPCFFVDEFGELTEITVPFHCALSDKNSKRARDLHLVRKLKQVLKEGECEVVNGEVTSLCSQLQTSSLRLQALDVLGSSKHTIAGTMLEVTEGFLHALQNKEEGGVDLSSKNLLQRCLKLQKLMIFYLFCSNMQQKPPDYDTVITADASNDLENLCEFLRMSQEDTLRIVNNSSESGNGKVKVKFKDGSGGLSAYLAGFQTDTNSDMIHLVEPTTLQNLVYISEVVCGCANSSPEMWAAAATESTIDPLALLKLCVASWLTRRTSPTPSETLAFGQTLMAICNIDVKRVTGEAWWESARSLLRETTQPGIAVVAAVVCKAVAVTFEESAVMTASTGTDDSETKPGEWEKVSQDSCTWSVLISHLEDLALLNSVLRHKPESSESSALICLPYIAPDLSLQNVSSKGKGCLSELVAVWLAGCGMEPSLLLERPRQTSPSHPSGQRRGVSLGVTEGQLVSAEEGVEVKPISGQDSQTLSRLETLRMQFPYSLADSVLLANIAWEYGLAWSRKVDDLKTLQAAVSCLKVIPCSSLTQGVCLLLWMMHLKARFESTVRLINKIGKVPKERLCRQDSGLSELQIPDFFSTCSDFFDIFLESVAQLEDQPREVEAPPTETIWDAAPVPPLQQLALDRPPARYGNLLLLSQCCRAMLLLATFSLRTPRLLANLFDSVGQSVLFADVSACVQLPNHVIDANLIESRTTFLLRAVTGAVGTITLHNGEYNMSAGVEWMKQCLMLASDWAVPADPLRRQQCCQLYARGFDRLAEEVIPSVSETGELGSQLLVVAGQRLRLSMAESRSQLKEQITHMSPALSSWIAELGEGNVEPTSESDILELVVVASSLLDKENDGRRIATLLIDALAPLVNKGRLSDR